MSQKAPNGDATGASEEQTKLTESMCMICQESSSIYLLSCCGHPLCESCFEGIRQHHDGKKEPPMCPSCKKPITALLPNGDATRAEKRAAIAARVTKAREERANQALMEQFVSMFMESAKDVTKKVTEIMEKPQKIPKCTQGAIFCSFRNLLKKKWTYLPDFCQEFGQTFRDSKSEFAEGSGPWQNLVGCWDFQATHLLAIKEWHDTLPKGTVLLDPCAGKGLLAACLNVFGIPVVCNDIESQQSPFVTDMSTMDGIQFMKSYIAANPETPVAIVLSWAPQKGHPGEHFSEAIFRFAHTTMNVLAVIHISEGWMGGVPGGRVGCTDTVEALVFKAEHFQTILDLPREYPPQWKNDCGIPIDDHLTINVPKRD
jgi:hypothetical protein